MTGRTVALPPPCGWARIGLRNGRAYIADTYTLNPYPPPADVAERLNVVPVHDEPTVRRLLAEARAHERAADRIAELEAERDALIRDIEGYVKAASEQAADILRLEAESARWLSLYRRAVNEANGLTNYVEERPELFKAERRLAAIESEARAALEASA